MQYIKVITYRRPYFDFSIITAIGSKLYTITTIYIDIAYHSVGGLRVEATLTLNSAII